jgi:hypothetical protein
MLVKPAADILQRPKIHNKAILIKLLTTEHEREGPVVPMDKRTMSRMPVLPMREWYIRISL